MSGRGGRALVAVGDNGDSTLDDYVMSSFHAFVMDLFRMILV
jgi:hypothetical protein